VKELKQALAHVYWLGGSPCSGKSSITRLLAERYHFKTYHCDDAFPAHQQRHVPRQHPTFQKISQMTWDEIWGRPLPALLADEIALYREESSMILDDLLALPQSTPVLAEGTALLPAMVLSHLQNRQQAIWVVPAEQFQRAMYPKRGEWVQKVLRQCTRPQQAFQKWMDRDVHFARWVIKTANELGLPVLKVDGQRSIAENAAAVAASFGL
jgi:2-phosphoglycerate kinase